ncbi:MAG: UDP-2,3-diacylglucosamine diphosphatase [Bacteroidetes bacterium]|nr:UDP-2,3-diacylglucosamine diphosphatase [Bacteroidota bacterium]
MPGQMVYFLSDFHLGVPDHATSLVRERRIVAFLEEAAKDATEIHILGDLFDMWFEYKQVVPRGFTRLLGKLSELHDRGIPVHIHIGNHDMWAFDYLPEETGVTLHQEPIVREWNGKRLYIGHGDGLGPGDHGYKFIRKVFRNPFMQWCFARLHPNLGLGIAHFWSGRSRKKNYENDRKWLGADKEWLVQYCNGLLEKEHYDYFIFGHRHLPVDLPLASGPPAGDPDGAVSRDPEGTVSRYINLGDWISHFTYAVFDGGEVRLMKRVEDGALGGDVRISGGPAV